MAFTIERYGRRHWAIYERGVLLCVTVYKKGARAVIDRVTMDAGKENSICGSPLKTGAARLHASKSLA